MAFVKVHVQNNLTSNHLFILTAAAAIAIWATVSLTIRILTVLKRRSGLYFWALLIATWGISIRQLGILTIYLFPGCPWAVRRILVESGWVAMVTGFSTVLYSRLSIVVHNHRVRRAVLVMIIANALIWHPMVIATNAGIRYLKNTGQTNRLPPWQRVHDPVEKIQIVMFSAQEITISSFYVLAAYRYLQSGFAKKDKVRGAMCLLMLVQVIIVSVDITIIVLDLAGYLRLKTFIHSFVYTVKLELEFVTLNQLVELSKLGMPGAVVWSPSVVNPGASSADDKMKNEPDVVVAVAQRDSAVDLEPCKSHKSWGSIDFITTPEHIYVK
ncbi:hypothetical protein FB567DRAFT_587661 [Paraphoma chrysanthemicola]|uniref:DUF7703 domain-containing protein n=1 Tax=Paraphoma chrysanthemicola TaxID=798071 RepID=A0A8K0RF37_9PLEO|nr:hypothetical protein FB567DRAFT_587661 [Paraphoma chrysanthemicola]